MPEAALDVVCIGNAIVDVLSQCDDATIDRLGLARDTMSLIDAARVQPNEMAVVLERLLPGALRSRGVDAPEALCAELARGLAGLQVAPQPETPDAVFRRLGG